MKAFQPVITVPLRHPTETAEDRILSRNVFPWVHEEPITCLSLSNELQ